mmetsp:Transcript_27812/g.66084  ORF Transcript_27812/g.66084 Transcript_27812/m.66084 type:complete len:106 (+) Transcript_27812:478-795(+)
MLDAQLCLTGPGTPLAPVVGLLAGGDTDPDQVPVPSFSVDRQVLGMDRPVMGACIQNDDGVPGWNLRLGESDATPTKPCGGSVSQAGHCSAALRAGCLSGLGVQR